MSKNKKNLIRISVAAALFFTAFGCYLGLEERAPDYVWAAVFFVPYIVIAYDVLIKAAKNIIRGKVFDENFLMIVASAGAFVIGEYPESVAVMLFYQVGEFFQNYAVGKSRKSIAALMDIRPQSACVMTEDGEKTVDPEEVAVGSLIVVRPGERIPIDGVITDGETLMDMSALTGESVPVRAAVGDEVLSGGINASSVIRVKTKKPYADSAVSKILDLVENASAKKAKTENFITRFAAVYTPAVVAAAVILAVVPPLCIGIKDGGVWLSWLKRALTFLVVSCPCALVISVPMSFFGGIGAASRRGILVKGGNYLELLARTQTIVFDKTGTVTKGSFEVVNVVGERERVLDTAAVAEYGSLHPVARSIVAAAGITAPPKGEVTETAGRGVVYKADGRCILCGNEKLLVDYGVTFSPIADCSGTVVYVAENGEYLGAIEIADALKEDSVAAIREIKEQGIKTVMLTGDRNAAAMAVAQTVGVDECFSELLPSDKVDKLEAMLDNRKDGKDAVAFVGDGINDAPVLSRADVGIAMGALGSDAAIEAADIVLMNDSLKNIPVARRIAKRTLRIALQNIVFALVVKLAILVLAACGIATMWLAVFGDVGVAVIAILNSMRCLKPSREKNTSTRTHSNF